jgi:peptidoglycan/LPS O-acetylase OafA/YrhL
MQNEKSNYDSFDLLKFICSLMIIFLHLNPFSKDGTFYYLSRAFANIGVPVFFILSGFFFFRTKMTLEEKHQKLTRYVKHLFIMLLFWMIPYFLVSDLWWIVNGNVYKNLLEYLHHIVFGGSGFFLWYLVAQIVAMVLCCLLTALDKKLSGCIVLVLFAIGTAGSSYTYLFENTWVNQLNDIYIQYCYTFRNGVFMGLPFVYAGMLIAENQNKIPGLGCTVSICVCAVCGLLLETLFMKSLNIVPSVMQLSITLLSISVVLLFYRLDLKVGGVYTLRKLSFLVYVIHPLYIIIIPKVLYYLKGMDYYWYLWYWLQIPIVAVAAILTGLMLIQASKKIKFLKKVM